MELPGKVALVLGGIKGIGKAIALALAEAGAAVAVNYFDWEEELEPLRRDMAATGRDHLILRTDLRQVDDIGLMVPAVLKRFGRLDILINNIERGGWPIVHGPYTAEQWDLELETMLRAKRWVFAAALPHLRASCEGSVINFSSIAGRIGRAGPAAPVFNDGYAAANRALSLLTETWAREAAPEVRVTEIMLGLVETRHGPGTRGWGLLSEAQKKAILDHTLLGRTGRLVGRNWSITDNGTFTEGTIGDSRLCWGCHDSVGVNDMYGDSNAETVSAGNTPTHWQGSWIRPASTPFTYKGGATRYFRASHFYPSKTATWGATGVPTAGRTAVECVSCHNPHGNATDSQYWAWALKGTWLTSPYKEDRVPQNFTKTVDTVTLYTGWSSGYSDPDVMFDAGPRTQPRIAWSKPPNPGGGYNASDGGSNGTGYDGYFIDDNIRHQRCGVRHQRVGLDDRQQRDPEHGDDDVGHQGGRLRRAVREVPRRQRLV